MKKSTKVELVSAVAMLLVAAIMMTSASFAWFTLSTAPEISGVEMSMGVTGNLEIAKATNESDVPPEVTSNDAISGDETTWGGSITSYEGASGVQFPAEYIDSAWKTIEYAADGRTNGSWQGLSLTSNGAVNGVRSYSAQIHPAGSDSTPITRVVAVGYLAWIRSNQDLSDVTVHINTTNVTFSGIDATKHTGNYAFVKEDANIVVYVDGNPVADGQTFSLAANTPKLIEIMVSVKGEHVIAQDVTSGSSISITGLGVNFTSTTINNINGITN